MKTTCATRRIFYGVQATGRGHLSRFRVASQILEEAGHSVFGYASGQDLPDYATGISHFEKGPTFFVRNNRIDPFASLAHNVASLPSYYGSLKQLKSQLLREKFDAAIVDFEPISARALQAVDIPVTLFDNQTMCLLSLPELQSVSKEISMLRRFVKLYYGPAFLKARKVLTYSLIPAQPSWENQIVVPPCVRTEVATLNVSHGDHILFYSSIGSIPTELIAFAERHREVEVRAYVAVPPKVQGMLPGNILLPNRNSASFLNDFASCRLYISGAGFESIAEAISLNKPLLAIPIGGQWEQRVNATIINEFNIGMTAPDLTLNLLETAYESQRQPDQEVRDWVKSGRSTLQAALCAL
jgi:uncharacterized protein (TIGR00661 family)